ncbi:DUF5126 domain-containing protein [Sphingobacterium tabacisoli]|uniref:DUF5126 domain-containing protein n=1 Tax=Sphingobacterium tabacisoli TaxID=2044855 RepID=A0ABW5KY65_9SPHI|nr:DUF5126 domain-containing protein [Sphingobacterium tabacisoli]
MQRYITYAFIMLTSSLMLLSCMDSYMGLEKLSISSEKPGKLTVDKVEPRSGGLEIYFTLPKGNPNNVQVIATYKSKLGNTVEFKASRYSNVILVEGLTGTDEVAVELVSMDESGNRSDVVVVKEKPLLSPVEIARQSLLAIPAFGGVKLTWENNEAQAFAIHVLTEEEIQKGVVKLMEDPSKRVYSSSSKNTAVYLRQYGDFEQKFGFVLTDKWGNRTDTLVQLITPYKEEIIDYKLVKAVSNFNPTYGTAGLDYALKGVDPVTGIQNDGTAHSATFQPQTMFNGITAANEYLAYKFFVQQAGSTAKSYVQDLYATFDLNQDLRLSRVQVYPRPNASYLYTRSSVKRFKIWGTNDANTSRWSRFPDGWTLVGEYVGKMPVFPSAITDEERDYFYNKQEFSIVDDNINPEAKPASSFRYMRLQMMEAYTATETFYTINEFKLFGEVLKKY